MDSRESAPTAFRHWTTPGLPPVVLLYVVLVFAAFLAVSHFLLHSSTGTKALAIGAVGFLIPLLPKVLSRQEYRLTADGLERRGGSQSGWRRLFAWDQLDRIAPTSHGFQFFLHLEEPNRVKRFWKLRFSDRASGEFHVGREDRHEVGSLIRAIQSGAPTPPADVPSSPPDPTN